MLEVRFSQQLTMDPRGRVTLPSRLRSALETHRISSLVFIVHGKRLRAYVPKDFAERVEAPLLADDAFDPYQDEKQLLRLGSASEVDVDKQGRLVIPPELRELVSLGEDITMVSMLDRLEVWNSADFKQAFAQAQRRTETLGGYGSPGGGSG